MNSKVVERKWALLLGLVLIVAVAAGCAKKKSEVSIDTPYEEEDAEVFTPETTRGGEGLPDIDQERLLWDPATGLQPVYFAFDSYALRADARETLQDNASKIMQAPGALIQIEGHCDERGTQEYNLALGEKRALAVRDYLIQLGVSGDRLVTISYGEEYPAVIGSNEAAWAQNRRCEFNKARM
jgi:peptidoglycan-associated lipoprotein